MTGPYFSIDLRAAVVLLVATAGGAQAAALDAHLPSSMGPCETAGTEAEREFGLPAGLLVAIGHVESGRRDKATGAVQAWPWSINVEGQDRVAETAPEAIGLVRELQATGHRSLDVGCFQVNLMYHPTAFASLDEAFDPGQNARAAAAFLAELHTQSANWPDAIARYHSANTDRGGPYRDRVLQRWAALGSDSDQTAVALRVSMPTPVQSSNFKFNVDLSHLPVVQIPTQKIKYW